MTTRNAFISHIHEDDEGVSRIKEFLKESGMTVRNGSITVEKFNRATSEDYIKYEILAPRIDWAGVLVAYITPGTSRSRWVDWEIEHAHRKGKRIVGVYERGAKGCEIPDALDRHADAIVGWHRDGIVAAIEGRFNGRVRVAKPHVSALDSVLSEWWPVIALAGGIILYLALREPPQHSRTLPYNYGVQRAVPYGLYD